MKKLGFTLIELLAVILILGIIALIAIPTINNIIKESKKGAFKSSAQNIISSIEQKCRMEQLKGETITKYYRFEDGVSLTDAGFKGEVPSDGSIVVDDECNIDIVVNKENYIAVKSKEEDEVTIIEDTYYKPGTLVIYNPGDNNYTNWYVLKDNGDTITLLLDRNLSDVENGLYIWCTGSDYINDGGTEEHYMNISQTDRGPLTALNGLATLTNSWNTESKTNIRLLSIGDILEVLGMNNWNGEEFYFDTKTNVAPVVNGVSKYSWLFNNMYECIAYGCEIQTEIGNSPYWMNDGKKDSLNLVFAVSPYGKITTEQNLFYSSEIGRWGYSGAFIRPVITISKSSITNN